jgi:hypothetical protein
MMVLTDAFLPEGVTMMFQDSVFMMPHLGVLSTVHPDAAWQIFDKDCLVRLGSVIAPSGLVNDTEEVVMEVAMEMPDGNTLEVQMRGGELKLIDLPERQKVRTTIRPRRGFDIGSGSGRELITEVEGGVVGVLLDTRGRPLTLPEEAEVRKKTLLGWIDDIDMYPVKVLGE